MRKTFGAIATAAALAFAGPMAAQDLPQGKVGLIVQLSGTAAQFGLGVQKAVQVAQQDLKDRGVIDLTVHYEDHQQQAQLGLLGFEKLVDTYDVPVVIANASPVVLAIGPAAADREVLVYNFAAVSPRIRELAPWVVTGTPTAERDAVELASYMYDALGLRNPAIIHVNDQNGVTFTEAFTEAFTSHGGSIAATESNEQAAVDMRTQLIKIKNSGADALVILSNIPEGGYIAAQAKELGLNLPLFSNTFIMDPENFRVGGDSLDGLRGVTLAFIPEAHPNTAEFAKKFEALAGRGPSVNEALAYDGTMLVGEAIAAVGEDPAAIREYIVSVKDWEATTGQFNFDEDGMVVLGMSTFEIVDGKPVFAPLPE